MRTRTPEVVVSHEEELVVNVVLPDDVAREVEAARIDGVTLERGGGDAHAHRFGVAEAVAVVALVKGVLELVKLALEIRDKLRAAKAAAPAASAPTARISVPGLPSWVELTAGMSDAEVRDAIRRHVR